MSKKNLQEFSHFVLCDLTLQDQLKNLVDRDAFTKKLIELAASSGFEISSEDVEVQIREARKLWNERWI